MTSPENIKECEGQEMFCEHPMGTLIYAAGLAHEVNRAVCRFACADTSQPSWPDAPQWQKDSALDGVKKFVESRYTMTPEESHDNWVWHKASNGWVYGDVKDPEKRTHPCMVPYADLPPQQKIKDALFVATVKAALGVE